MENDMAIIIGDATKEAARRILAKKTPEQQQEFDHSLKEDNRRRLRSKEKEERTKHFSISLLQCMVCNEGQLVYTRTVVWSQSNVIGQRSREVWYSEICKCDYCGVCHAPTAPMIAKLVEAYIARVEAEVDAEFDAEEEAEDKTDSS